MKEFPRTLKLVTLWLLIGTAVFVAVLAWQARQQRALISVAGGVIELRRGTDGHFHWPGTVNGIAADFIVDTGATRTALPQALARAARLQADGAVRSATAGGTAHGYSARAEIALNGGVVAERLPVTVLPALGAPLLGMDVLSRLSFSQSGGVMRVQGPSR